MDPPYLALALDGVSCQLYALAASLLLKQLLMLTEQEAGWAPRPVWALFACPARSPSLYRLS
jgi:hypothetical protein